MAETVIMPRLSLNEETSLLSEWYVKEGDTVSVGDKLFSIETDKSSMDVDSDYAGTILKEYYSDYEVVQVLTPVCVIGEPGEEVPELDISDEDITKDSHLLSAESDATSPSLSSDEPITKDLEEKGISPRAKVLAGRNGITDFSGIRPSGAENRIQEEDIIQFMKTGGETEVKTGSEEKKVVKLPKIRKVIAQNMMNSLQSTAQLTLNSVFNATAIQNLRAQFKADRGEMKNVTIGDLILFAVSRTLLEFPYMNAWMENDDEEIEFGTVNLGVAVDTDRGLMVPTIPSANTKSLLRISTELKSLASQCREGNIAPDKLQNATFTVSNMGAYGIRNFTPVLNPPQVGILGVGTIDYMVKKTEEGLLYYPACSLSLTIDHRLVDGAPGARFLKKLCENLENIETLIKDI